MANDVAKTQTTNIVPVQGIFLPEPTFDLVTFIGPAGTPFYATVNPNQSGLNITNSTINSTTIGATTPSTGVFTNISTTTGQVSTTPSANTDIANKFYVDTVAQGLGPKAACAVTTLTSITLSGLQLIDGYTTLAGDRVLVKNQSTSSENGIYIASASAWTRSTDMDVWSEVPGAYTVILNGSQANTGWVCTATSAGTIGVTAMPWVQFSGSATYFAGTGLTLSANTFSITNTGVTAASVGSASKTLTATVNAQGQLTALADTNIAIAATQITSGTIDTARISGSYTGITGVGTLTTGIWNATAIGAGYGGTGLTGYTTGDLLVASGATSLTTLSDVATGNALISGGVGLPPFYGKIGLTTHVSGTLPVSNGGTNGTATPTAGAVAYGTGTAYAFTAAGTTGQVLTSNGASSPTWTTIGGGDVTGPSSSTDNAIARFDGTSGKLIQNSVTTIDDTGNASGILSQQFSNGSAVTVAAGKMWYDGSDGSWNLGMGNGNITQQVGEELYRYGKASAAITDSPLQLVYKTGVVGASGAITFAPAVAGITDYDQILGCATENIALNGFGRVTSYGVIHNITTNGTAYGETWADNDDIYYNPTTGGLTKTLPSAPGLKVLIGTVINAGSGGSGSFIVKLGVGTYLSKLSDVQISGVANNDLMQYVSANSRWQNIAANNVTVGTATNLAGGVAGAIPWQSGAGATGFTAAGTTGQVLQSNGTSVPTWVTPTAYATVTDDTTTASTRYPLFASVTAGNLTTEYVSSTKLQYVPSTGVLTATGFSGSGASLTSLTAGNLSGTIPSAVLGNSTVYIGTTAVALNRASASISLTGTNIDGSAGSATTATTATNATNVAVTDNTSSASVWYPTFVSTTTGNLPVTVSSTKLKYTPSTGALTASQLIIAP